MLTMASCTSGALQGIFETVCLAGGLSGCEFITATSSFVQRTVLTALATSVGDIFIYCQKDGKSTVKVIPWSSEDSVKPAALAFSPTAEWLLVAIEDGRICILPVGKHIHGLSDGHDRRFPMNDVVMHQPNGSRARPTAIVWWQTITGDASVAIIGTELGELCFVELTSGKDVGGTYITVPVKEMFLCQDNSQDTVYLLITGTEDRQWRLVLEQKSHHYMFPLENISPEWDEDESLVGPLSLAATAPSPRLRLMNLKQLSVEKFQLLKQRLSEAKYSSRKKPMTENKGVDTCDIDEEPSANSTIITPQSEMTSSSNTTHVTTSGTTTTTSLTTNAPANTSSKSAASVESSPSVPAAAVGGVSIDNEPPATAISARPERLYKYIYDVVASPQFNREKCLLAGHYKPNSCLMVYSTDLENTPLYVYKLPEDTVQVVLHEEIIFALRKADPPRISVVSTFYAASTKIDGEIDNKIDPILQEIYLPEREEVLYIFPCPASPTATAFGRKARAEYSDKEEEGVGDNRNQEMDDTDSEFDYEVDLPSHTKPNACLVVTKSSLYLCQTRKSVENLFMELALGAGEIEAANRLAAIFSLDSKLFELAADFKLQKRCFAAAIMLYKQSRCPHVKCSLKFAWAGFVPEFITYMSSLTSGAGGPDLGLEQRKHLATLAVFAHLHQLSLPVGVRTLQQQQTTLRNLLLLLRNNAYYDEILTLVVATATWRWETLQYLASNRGLLLEKLHALLNLRSSPIIASLHPSKEAPPGSHKNAPVNPNDNGLKGAVAAPPICREKEKGFLHCVSDPELRGVLLVNPLLARSHMAFVLDHLDALDVAILRRLAALYDPTQPAIRPFLLSAAYFQKPAVTPYPQAHSKLNQQCSLLPPASDDPIGLDTLTQVFLAILIKLNQKRGWKYNPDLLTLSPIEPVKKNPFYDTCLKKKPIACGYGHSTVIIGGIVYSWGLGDCGALGHPPKSSTNPFLLQGIDPILCAELKDLMSSQTGPEFFAPKKEEPLVQSPDGTNGECFQPKVVSYLSNMKTYSVACGKNYTLAITNYGVYGWGNNRYGQVGTGGTGSYPRPTLITSLVIAEVVQIACGQFHSLAVTKDGRLFTWGWGVHGQLGHGNVEDCLKPTLVKRLFKKVVVRAAGGYAHSVALTNKGTVYAWGCSTYGQVGTGGISKVTSPARVQFSSPVTHLVTAYFHNVAVTSDHKVFVWGSNPACLRVQAQIQRRNRSVQQQQAQEQESVHENPPPPPPTPDTENVGVGKQPEILEKNDRSIKTCSSLSEGNNEDAKAEKSPTADPEGKDSGSQIQGKELEMALLSRPGGKSLSNLHLVSANTVPSCDPMELGHLLPKEVEMPLNYGAVKALAVGNQHSLLLTTHGSLYAWGRNMSGQLGTGSRKESVIPVRVMEDVYVTEIGAGADFSLALDSHGQVWGWGSNYYTQLGQGSNSGEEKTQGSKVFMLRTAKRVLKVPHSIHSNVEVPRPVARLPTPTTHTSMLSSQYGQALSNEKVDLNDLGILSGVELASLESPSEDIPEKDMMEDKDDGLYGTITLHSSLAFIHHHYSPKSLAQMLVDCEGHQALATLYTLEKQHNKAMHHQLCALLSHSWIEEEGTEKSKELREGDRERRKRREDEGGEAASETSQAHSGAKSEGKSKKESAYSSSRVNEAVRILDHFLRLQTEESQSGMRLVLQEGIGLWLTHSLPIPQLEDLLLTHLPRTVYPLALLLFGEENPRQNAEETKESGIEDLAEATARILSQLSTKFCLNLCSSVITHLQAGECNIEQLDALSQLARLNLGSGAPTSKDSTGTEDEEKFPYNTLMDSLEKSAPDAILLSPEEVSSLRNMSEEDTADDKSVSNVPSTGAKNKKEPTRGKSLDKEKDKDCVLFTCGHHFTSRDFKTKVLPQLERTVTTVPGLLGKTARVLLDQYHSDQPQMACPHCVLAHLTIKLTKHNQPT